MQTAMEQLFDDFVVILTVTDRQYPNLFFLLLANEYLLIFWEEKVAIIRNTTVINAVAMAIVISAISSYVSESSL